ncbi:PAS domain-containing sensor histidine kinase, partial [Microvirga sp. 3-52]|nr:PAS domain-containing sensor histidine kinase [Microvirga sp. 3-52]
MTLYKYEVSVIPFITRIANKFTQVARESHVDLQLNFSKKEILAELDADRIEQVVTNLIDNAIRHTPDKGC